MNYYRKELDGLRAIAVTSVILSHVGIPGFSSGYVGVDIFFVISGYLIALHSFRDAKEDKFRINKFYLKRFKRIFPALLLMVVITTLVGLFLMWPSPIMELSTASLSSILFYSNYYFWLDSGYFSENALIRPLIHTWSLSIEEQFYLFFPIIVIFAGKKNTNFAFKYKIILLMAGSYIIYMLGLKYYSNLNYYSTFSRIWEILLGVLLSMTTLENYKNQNKRMLSELVDLSAFCAILLSILYEPNNGDINFYSVSLAAFGAAAIILNPNTSYVKRIFSSKLFTYTGVLSYSLYLWHQPILAFYRINYGIEIDLRSTAFLLITIVLIAILSFKFIEIPFRNGKYKLTWLFIPILFQLTLILAIQKTNGFENIKVLKISDENYNLYKTVNQYKKYNLLNNIESGDCHLWTDKINSDFFEKYQRCFNKYGKSTLVAGDSHAINLYNSISISNQIKFLVGVSSGGCIFDINSCFYKDLEKFINEKSETIDLVVFNFAGYTLMQNSSKKIAGTDVYLNKAPYTINESKIEGIFSYLKILSKKNRVILIGPYFEPWIDFDRQINFLKDLKNKSAIKIHEEINENLSKRFENIERNSNLIYINFDKSIFFNSYSVIYDTCLIYYDYDHLSKCGEGVIGNKLAEMILNAKK